jgi:hypothetical protein
MRFNLNRAIQQALQSPIWRTVTLTPYATGFQPISELVDKVYQSLGITCISATANCATIVRAVLPKHVITDRASVLVDVISAVASYVADQPNSYIPIRMYRNWTSQARKMQSKGGNVTAPRLKVKLSPGLAAYSSSWKSGFVLDSDFDRVREYLRSRDVKVEELIHPSSDCFYCSICHVVDSMINYPGLSKQICQLHDKLIMTGMLMEKVRNASGSTSVLEAAIHFANLWDAYYHVTNSGSNNSGKN